MPIKAKIDKPTETSILPIPFILVASVMVFSILSFVATYLPNYSTSTSYFYVSVFLSVVGIFSSLWLNQKPNLLAKFFKYLSLSALFTLIAIRMTGYLLPTLSTIARVCMQNLKK